MVMSFQNKKVLFLGCILWTIFVLYPNPFIIVLNLQRGIFPPVNPRRVKNVSSKLPHNATFIDNYLERTINYSYDWQVYNVPWYFPNPREVLDKERGDCKAKSIVLASVLEDKGINYSIGYSPIHWWVDYEGKTMGEFERKYETGKLPSMEVWVKKYKKMFWDSMPLTRKILLIGGLISIALIYFISLKKDLKGRF